MAEFAGSVDGTAMGADDVLDDRQPKASPPGFPRAVFVYAVKALEESRQVLASDAWPKISDVKLHALLVVARTDLDEASRSAVLHGVIEQIGEDLVHGVGIGQHASIELRVEFEFNAASRRIGAKCPRRVGGELETTHGTNRKLLSP